MPEILEGTNVYANLEDLVDANGIGPILDALASICAAKSDHIRTNYSDYTLAKIWDAKGRKLARFADKHFSEEIF